MGTEVKGVVSPRSARLFVATPDYTVLVK